MQGFLVLGVQLNLNVFVHISKELIANKNSGYVLNQEQTEMNITNFYRKFIICYIYSVFHHRPSNLMIVDVHLSQRQAYFLYYVCTVISATYTCMLGRQPKIIKIFQKF